MAWTQLNDLLGTARSNAVGFSIGTNGYVGLGTLSSGAKANDFWAYNSANNTWSQKANFPGAARYGAVGFNIGTKGYVGLGADSIVGYKDFYEYDPASNSWVRKTDFPLEGLRAAVGFGIGTKGYVGLGLSPSNITRSDFLVFDPAGVGSWSPIATFTGGVGRYASVCFVIGTKGYVGLGELGSSRTASFHEYNPSTNTWTAKDNFGGGSRSFAVAFSTTGNKGYVGLGYGDTAPAGYKTDLWSFDPTLGSGSQWVKVYDFIGSARYAAIGFGIGANGYVGTGSTGSILLKDFYKFAPSVTADLTSILTTKWDITSSIITITKDFGWDIRNLTDTSPYTLNLGWDIGYYAYTAPFSIGMGWDLFNWLQTLDTLKSFGWNINDYSSINLDLTTSWNISNYADIQAGLEFGWNIKEWEYLQNDLYCGWDISEYDNIQKNCHANGI